eukprot:1186016-Prorocentrum_minimum.AAC.1
MPAASFPPADPGLLSPPAGAPASISGAETGTSVCAEPLPDLPNSSAAHSLRRAAQHADDASAIVASSFLAERFSDQTTSKGLSDYYCWAALPGFERSSRALQWSDGFKRA